MPVARAVEDEVIAQRCPARVTVGSDSRGDAASRAATWRAGGDAASRRRRGERAAGTPLTQPEDGLDVADGLAASAGPFSLHGMPDVHRRG